MEIWSEVSVHGSPLLDGEGLELSEDGVEDDRAREYGNDREQDLDLLHLRDGAEAPRALIASVDASRLVEKLELVCVDGEVALEHVWI